MSGKLTKEEEMELASLESELSSGEADELASLEAELGTPEPMAAPAPQEVTADTQAFLSQDTALIDPEKAEKTKAFAMGALQGIPFAKDAVSAVQGTAELIDDQNTEISIDSISNRYHKNLDKWNKEIKEAETKYPGYFTAGDLTTSVATSFIPGASGIKGALALGGLSALSRAEQRTVQEAMSGAGQAFVMDRLGVIAGKGIAAAAKGISNVADESFKGAMGAVNVAKTRKLNKHLMRTNQSASDFADNLLGMEELALDSMGVVKKAEPLLVPGQTFEDTLDKVTRLKESRGKQMGVVLSSFDEVAGDAATIDPRYIGHKLKHELVNPLLTSDNPDSQKLGSSLAEYIDDMLTESEVVIKEVKGEYGRVVPLKEINKKFKKPLSLQESHKLAVDISSFVQAEYSKVPGASGASLGAQKKRVDGILRDIIDEKVDDLSVSLSSGKEGAKMQTNIFKQLKRDYGNLSIAEDLLVENVLEKNDGALGTLKRALGVRGLVAGTVAGAAGLGPVGGVAIGAAINNVINSQSFPANMAVGLRKLAESLEKAPDPDVVRRLSVAAGLGMDDFRRSVGWSIAHVTLASAPMERTSAAVKTRSESLYSLIAAEDQNLANEFSAVLETEDEAAIGTFMSQMSNHPRAKKYIQKGMGWDGKVWTPEDKAVLRSQLKKANLPLRQELEAEDALMKNGIIPTLEPQQRPGTQWEPRDKKAPRY